VFAFGDDKDTGVGTAGADILSLIAGGSEQMRVQVNSIIAPAGDGWALLKETKTSINPVYAFGDDIDTGMGGPSGGSDALSLIAGGEEGMRLTETATDGTGSSVAYLFKDASATVQSGLATGLRFFGYAISLLDDNEGGDGAGGTAPDCTLGGTGTADCFELPTPTSFGRLVLTTNSATAEYGTYTLDAAGVATVHATIGDHANMEVLTAGQGVGTCANAKLCLFDSGGNVGILNNLGATTTVMVQFWYD